MSPFSAFRRRHGVIERRFRASEQSLLHGLLSQLDDRLQLVREPRGDTDPLLQRLLPEAYRDDPLAELEYREAVRSRSAEAKAAIVRRMRADLDGTPVGLVRLDEEGAVLWLKGLGDLRLACATRYGVDAVTSGRGEHALLYSWLSWLQSGLVDAVAAGQHG